MKSILHYRTLLLGISIGLLISSLLVFFFSALFSYNHETNQVAAIMLAVSLLIYYVVETAKQNSTLNKHTLANNKIVRTILAIAAPILGSIILIQGDIRSWFLVIISTIVTWMIIK